MTINTGHQMPLGVAHGNALNLPQSRYILPSFVERTSYGVKESNPYNKLFEERIIFLGVQVDDASANDIMAQLLVLESLDPDRDITIRAESLRKLKRQLAELIAEHTGQTFDQITEDSDRDRWFDPYEALEYGFIDHVVTRASDAPASTGNGSSGS